MFFKNCNGNQFNSFQVLRFKYFMWCQSVSGDHIWAHAWFVNLHLIGVLVIEDRCSVVGSNGLIVIDCSRWHMERYVWCSWNKGLYGFICRVSESIWYLFALILILSILIFFLQITLLCRRLERNCLSN